jgi:ribonuclease P protein component
MISNRHRFHGYRALGLVYRFGDSARGPHFGVKARPNDRRRSYRAAVVVGRKINKSAAARNRIRRRMYESLRLMENELTPHDIVINIFSDSVRELSSADLRQQLKKQLRQIGALNSAHK